MSEKKEETVDIKAYNELEQTLHTAQHELEQAKNNELIALRIAIGFLMQERQQQ